LSKSITPSNKPDVRMNSLSALRLSSCSGEPCAAFEEPSALTTEAPITRICGRRARMRPTTSFMPFCAVSTDALPLRLKSLIPSSQIMAVTPESSSTSRSMRCMADGPPGNGFCGLYSAGPAI